VCIYLVNDGALVNGKGCNGTHCYAKTKSLYTLHALILTMETTRENLGIVTNFISTNPYPFNASLGELYGTAILTTGVTIFF